MDDKNGKKNARIYIRIWPSSDFSHTNIKVESNFKTLHVRCLQDFLPGKDHLHDPPEYWRFATDGIFYKTLQEDLYASVMENVLDRVLVGAEAVVVCYGQGGSGKSYTCFEITSEYQERGLAPRLISALFDEKSKGQSNFLRVRISCVEYLGAELVDLLQGQVLHHDLLKNVLTVPVESEDEAMKLLFEAMARRAVCNEAPYIRAHRGHCIFTIHVEKTSTDKSLPAIMSGKVHLVDLAGINCPKKNSWSKPQDIGAANLTKTFLEQVLILLGKTCQKQSILSQQLVCPVIRYLGNSLSNVAILRFIGHIRGSRNDLELTLSTLRFSEKVYALKCTTLEFDSKPRSKLVLENFEDEVASLTKQLQESTMLAQESDLTNISQARVEHLRRLVKSYLEGESSAETIMALQQTPLALTLFKEELDKLKAETAAIEYKIENLQFDDLHKPTSPTFSPSPSRRPSRVAATSLTGSLGRGKGKGSANSKEVTKTPAMFSKEVIKRKTSDSKETLKKQIRSSRGSIERQSGPNSSKEDIKQPTPKEGNSSKEKPPREGMKHTPSSTSGVPARTASVSSKRVKRVGSTANKKSIKGKSKEALAILDELSLASGPTAIEQVVEEPIVLPSGPLPQHADAWRAFLVTPNIAELQAAVNQGQLDTEQAHILYSKTVVKLTEARQAMVLARSDLIEAQNKRHMRGIETYDAEGRIMTSDIEHQMIREFKRTEGVVDLRLEALKVTKSDLDESIKKLSDMKRFLEDKFEEFCVATYQAPIPHFELDTLKDVVKPKELDDVLEHRIKHFNLLQKMFFTSSAISSKQ